MARSHTVVVGLAVAGLLAACSGDGGGIDLARGADVFANTCAACHGPTGQGTTAGPPLLHQYYVPSHHPDQSFVQAIRSGVSPHHWEFGPMPPVPALDDADIASVIAHVRRIQAEAGITD